MTSKAKILASTVSTGAVLADGTVASTEVTGLPTFPAGTIVGTSDTQTLTNKTISGADNTITVDGTNAVDFRGIPSAGAAKTGSYTLTTADRGEFVITAVL